MDDEKIIELYNARSESAVTETDSKYGSFKNSQYGKVSPTV